MWTGCAVDWIGAVLASYVLVRYGLRVCVLAGAIIMVRFRSCRSIVMIGELEMILRPSSVILKKHFVVMFAGGWLLDAVGV